MKRYFCLVLFPSFIILLGVNGDCIDRDSRCGSWAAKGECGSNPSYMTKNCIKSCNKCDDGDCKNKGDDGECDTWKKLNYCKENNRWYGYMKENCVKACGFCILRDQASAKGTEECVDKKAKGNCVTWKNKGYCVKGNKFYGYMTDNCRETCEFCKTEQTVTSDKKEACTDKQLEKDCTNWKNKGYCNNSSKFYRFMSDKCRETCGFCRKEKVLTGSQKKCLDRDTANDCSTWKDNGYCKSTHEYYKYMSVNCNKTCGFCKKEQVVSKSSCVDKEITKDCRTWKEIGYCDESSEYYKYTSKNCMKTCGYCTKAASNCKDAYRTDKCAEWAKQGKCNDNLDWMHVYCKKSCGKCSLGHGTVLKETQKSKDESVTQINEQHCGWRLKSRVVGGSDVAVGDWPWQVGLARSYNPKTPFCGGSLINKQWIVTANHCFGRAGVSSIQPEQLVIILGDHDISRDDGSELRIKASKIIRHEDYKLGSYDADIALVKLASPVTYNSFIKPVCLPDQGQNEVIGENCTVTGWGRLQEGGNQATVLQEAKLPIVSRKTCSEAFGFLSQITDNMVCAGFEKGGIDACQGDSGGPFVCQKGGKFQLTGVVSFGRGCARANLYGVYVKTSKYINWIKRKIKE